MNKEMKDYNIHFFKIQRNDLEYGKGIRIIHSKINKKRTSICFTNDVENDEYELIVDDINKNPNRYIDLDSRYYNIDDFKNLLREKKIKKIINK
ncbi:MAG: hypothetical protein ACOC3Z_02065 [Nanoarchaeota archaeon]